MRQPMNSLLIAVVLSAFVAGCAQPARQTAMVAPVSSQTILADDSPLRQNVVVDKVTGGKKTDPLWTSQVSSEDFQEALKLSLKQHTILGEAGSPMAVEANLLKLDQPLAGFDLTVTSTVRYVVRTTDDATPFDQTIVSPYTANFSSSALAYERLRLANEGAIRKSISDFFKCASGLPFTSVS